MRLVRLIIFIAATGLPFHLLVSQSLDRTTFFEEHSIASLFLSGSLKNIDIEKQKEVKRPGQATFVFEDGSKYSGPIELHGRGKLRFDYCDPPPLMLYFKTKQPSGLRNLGKLKLVWSCRGSDYYDQLVVKEYLIYRMYNLLTPLSLRVRLLNIQFIDSAKNGNPLSRKGFLIEDIDELARRNGCREYEDTSLIPMETNQRQYALVTVFQYMVANTDWSVSNYQNIKMVVSDTAHKMVPFVVPYDFDNSGLVNAEYAVPNEKLPIETVRERYNKGVSLKKSDIDAVRNLFMEKRDSILLMVEQCPELKASHKKDMLNYLAAFFKELENEVLFNNIFLKHPAGG